MLLTQCLVSCPSEGKGDLVRLFVWEVGMTEKDLGATQMIFYLVRTQAPDRQRWQCAHPEALVWWGNQTCWVGLVQGLSEPRCGTGVRVGEHFLQVHTGTHSWRFGAMTAGRKVGTSWFYLTGSFLFQGSVSLISDSLCASRKQMAVLHFIWDSVLEFWCLGL